MQDTVFRGGADIDDITALIRSRTRIDTAPLVPTINLHLATALTPLWQATESTLATTGMPPPFWAFAWPGGQAVARLLLDRPDLVRGRRVLDFAAGGGLIALAAAQCGAARVMAADLDPIAKVAIALNATLNGLAINVSLHDLVGRRLSDVDVVLAGDVFYERPFSAHILPWFRLLARCGKTVLIGDPGRAYLPKDGIEPVDSYTVPTDVELEDCALKETTVWRLLA